MVKNCGKFVKRCRKLQEICEKNCGAATKPPKPQEATLLHRWLRMFLCLFTEKIAKNCEAAENCDKLQTAIPPPPRPCPPLFQFKPRAFRGDKILSPGSGGESRKRDVTKVTRTALSRGYPDGFLKRSFNSSAGGRGGFAGRGGGGGDLIKNRQMQTRGNAQVHLYSLCQT